MNEKRSKDVNEKRSKNVNEKISKDGMRREVRI